MSASRVLPAWRPIHDCGQRTGSGACPQPNAFDRPDGVCGYHGKLKDGLIAMTGTESRRGVGNHSAAPRNRYDYDVWFDGKPHTLTRNKHFACDVRSMLSMLKRAADRHGVVLTVEHSGGEYGTITVQAQPKREAGAA